MAACPKSFVCLQCRFKFYLNTASAGVALIFNQHQDLLVTRRKHDPAKGMLDFPGGFAEPGETIEECLVREIKEELNLDAGSLTYFCSVPNTYVYKEVTYSITDFAFFCRIPDFGPIAARDDILDFSFMNPAALKKKDFGFESSKIILDRILNQKGKGMPGFAQKAV
nr:NUDIX domain-containing protein [Desulfobacula sp.]